MTRLRRVPTDLWMGILLILLWALFFWRLLTPNAVDQVSFKQGDFSGQFVAFGAYQYARWTAGEVPLWNPYNNGGLPFIADTQSAVFYPPRLLTIGLSYLTGGWRYGSLQYEAIAHVLAYSFFLYAFFRRLTLGNRFSAVGGLVTALVGAYGGYVAGYPPLQLALLEALIWLPMVLLGIVEATRTPKIHWAGLCVAGVGLGMSWLAGHPQTSWFCTMLALAWWAYRGVLQGFAWRQLVIGVGLFGVITFGVTAVTFLPSAEYLRYTTRSDMGFDGKANGFPFQDLWQVVFPYSVSLFSPLYVGIPALFLALLALLRQRSTWFWGGVSIIALLLSVGGNSVFYDILYQLPIGLSFFRGQERAASLVTFSFAVLAGYGMTILADRDYAPVEATVRQVLKWAFLCVAGLASLVFVLWLGSRSAYDATVGIVTFSALVMGLLALLLAWHRNSTHNLALIAVCLLLVFELFSVNMTTAGVYEHHPAPELSDFVAPMLLEPLLSESSQPFRVDGFRGLRDNYGSLFQVMDIRGISPLFLTSAQRIIYRDYIHNPLAWELFAVKYVYSERDAFRTPTTVIAEGTDKEGTVYLHRLQNPRPFAVLLTKFDVVDSDEFATALLNDPRYDARTSIILNRPPTLTLPNEVPTNATVNVVDNQPERLHLDIRTPENVIVSLAQVDYVGWNATLDGVPVPILRAYGALMAVEIPAGDHRLVLQYDPLSFKIGSILSLVTWLGIGLMAVVEIIKRLRRGQK